MNRWSTRRPFALTVFICPQLCGAPGGVDTKLKPGGKELGVEVRRAGQDASEVRRNIDTTAFSSEPPTFHL